MYSLYRFAINEEKGNHSKVYALKRRDNIFELVVKIYEESSFSIYEKERNILILIDENQGKDNVCFLMFKNIIFNQNMFVIPKEIKTNNLCFLFFDYLPKLGLYNYISETGTKIKEDHAKYLCYVLLKFIEKLHSIKISHNFIDIYNILFDNDFNPKLIHFSEASMVNNTNQEKKYNQDLFDLGQVLAAMLTSGKFGSIGYDENENVYRIYNKTLNSEQEGYEESNFWNNIMESQDIKISEQFINFFHILRDAKNNDKSVNISNLLKNEWLSEINNDIKKYQEIFKTDFQCLYDKIIEDEEIERELDFQFSDFIELEHQESLTTEEKKNLVDIKTIMKDIKELNINNNDYFKPRIDDFNYLEINILNEENKDIKEAINILMKNIKQAIYEEYEDKEIKVDIKDETNNSFKICYYIEPLDNNYEGIKFLDEKFERKIKNNRKLEIGIELVEGNKNLFEQKKINQYYLYFKRLFIDMEDFHEHMKFLKEIIKNTLKIKN